MKIGQMKRNGISGRRYYFAGNVAEGLFRAVVRVIDIST